MQRVVTSTLSTEIVRYSLDPEVVEPVVDFAVDTKYNVGNLKQSTNTKLHELPRFNALFSRIQEHWMIIEICISFSVITSNPHCRGLM